LPFTSVCARSGGFRPSTQDLRHAWTVPCRVSESENVPNLKNRCHKRRRTGPKRDNNITFLLLFRDQGSSGVSTLNSITCGQTEVRLGPITRMLQAAQLVRSRWRRCWRSWASRRWWKPRSRSESPVIDQVSYGHVLPSSSVWLIHGHHPGDSLVPDPLGPIAIASGSVAAMADTTPPPRSFAGARSSSTTCH
jgi:hypothetical protein